LNSSDAASQAPTEQMYGHKYAGARLHVVRQRLGYGQYLSVTNIVDYGRARQLWKSTLSHLVFWHQRTVKLPVMPSCA
jgi:hypothetical protein